MENNIPELEPICGSWTIVCRETGKAIFETFEKKIAEVINQNKYEVMTTYQYLININRRIKAGEV